MVLAIFPGIRRRGRALRDPGGPTMAAAERCPKCGSALPTRSPEGLCPRCLMRRAMAGDPPVPAGRRHRDGPAATGPGHSPEPAQADLEATEAHIRPASRRRDAGPRRMPPATGRLIRPTRCDHRRPRGHARPPARHDRPLLRRLRDPGRAGPRRHGRRLQGPAGQPQPARRPQDDPGRRPGRRRRAAPVPERGRGGRAARPPRHRAGLRGRRARRPALLHA